MDTAYIGFLLVALCWGFTNPFIKVGSRGLDKVSQKYRHKHWLVRWGAEMRFLFTRWQYVLPLAINLSGSVVYYYTLGHSELSLAVPICNSLTFALTALAGKMVGEEFGGTRNWAGLACVLAGVTLCVVAKS